MPSRAARFAEQFEQERDAIEPDFFHFDEGFRYSESILLDRPKLGLKSTTEGVWIVTLRFRGSTGETIRFSIFYRFDPEYVTFLSIKRHGREEAENA
jgi:hypothetical protein